MKNLLPKNYVALLSLSILFLSARVAMTAIVYWDSNGATAGAGATPTGTWGTSAFWSTASDGTAATAAWTSGDTAVFSAGTDASGTFTVTLSGTQTAGAINVEEGTVSFSGTGAASIGAGSVTISSGATLSVDNAARIAATAGSTFFINGGTMRNTVASAAGSFIDIDAVIVLGSGGGTVSYTTAGVLNIIQTATIISGTGPLTKTGAGILAIASPCTYSGATIINDGTLRIRATSNRLPIGTDVTVNSPGVLDPGSTSGNVQQVNTINGNGNITFSASSSLIIAGAGDSTLTGVISDGASTGRIGKLGAGILTLSGLNTYDGTFTNDAGTTIVTPGATLAGAGADLVVHGGLLILSNTAQTVLSLFGNGGTIDLPSGQTLTVNPSSGVRIYAGSIAGPGQLVKSGAGTLGLSGSSTYDGTTFVNAGKLLVILSSTALGSTVGGTEVASGAELLIEGSTNVITISEPLRIAGPGAGDGGAITVQSSANATISGPVTLTGDATNTVSSTATVVYDNTAAITSLANQNLTLQGGSGAGGGGTISGTISLGSGSLTKLQGGRWTFSASNDYSGGTVVSAGTLIVNNTNGSGTGSGAVTVNSGATLGGTGIISGPVTIASGGTLAPGASIGTLTFGSSPTLSGTVAMEINKSGASLTGDKLVVNGNPLAYGGSLTVTATGDPIAGGDTFDLFDASSFSGSFTSSNLPALGAGLNWWLGNLTANGTITVNNAPVANNTNTARLPGLSLKMAIADLLASSTTDPDGDARAFQSVGTPANGGATSSDATFIYYSSPSDVADSFSYTIRDARGGVSSGTIGITIAGKPAGLAQSINTSGGGPVTVNFAGIPNYHYDVERSEDLNTWTVVASDVVAASNGLYQFIDPTPPQPSAYYRSRQH